MKIRIERQDQFFLWRTYGTSHNHGNAYRTAKQLAKSTGKRHRLVDEKGNLLDLINP